jgi:hypothetical protein
MSMTVHHRERQAARGQSRADRIEYRLLVAIAFVICFVMAGASRLVAAHARQAARQPWPFCFCGGEGFGPRHRGLRVYRLTRTSLPVSKSGKTPPKTS